MNIELQPLFAQTDNWLYLIMSSQERNGHSINRFDN